MAVRVKEGDLIMMGPPLIIQDEEIEILATRVATAVGRL
jgi:adenosylmethionine-8-amino-7-oxononanoate aminotransferase